jgi:hypothetical protein
LRLRAVALLLRLFVFPISKFERRFVSIPTDPKPKTIKAAFGPIKTTIDGNVTPLFDAVLKGLGAHLDVFSKLPVDLATFEAAVNAYKAAIPASLDGSRSANAQKKKLRKEAIQIYELNGKYVEQACNHDIATFLLSGYQAASTTKTQPSALPTPTIASIVQGPASGQLKVIIGVVPKALSFWLRHGVVPAGGGPPSTWEEQTLTRRKPVMYTGLTPGTVHGFQVKALGRLGFTDYSEPVTKMVI